MGMLWGYNGAASDWCLWGYNGDIMEYSQQSDVWVCLEMGLGEFGV